MKMLFMILTMLISLTAIADIGPVGSSTNLDGTGAVIGGTLEQRYINVKNQLSVTATKGAIMVWDVSNDDGYSVTTSATAGTYPACVMPADCAAGALCKCQTYGYHSGVILKGDMGFATAGQKIFISESFAGQASGIAAGSISADDVAVGFFYDTLGTTGNVEAFINIK